MTASKLLPSTQLAKMQERIMECTDYIRGDAAILLAQLRPYDLLLKETHNSNLHVRQAFIRAGLNYICQIGVPSEDVLPAMDRASKLLRGMYWSEGPDYHSYTKEAADWYRTIAGMDFDEMACVSENYAELVAPDGTIPVPEASGRTYPVPDVPSVSNDKYIVNRWPSGAYLLVDVGTECDPENLHDWLSAGYFAFGAMRPVSYGKPQFQWVVRCGRYAGFSWSNVLTNDALASCLPKGALLPTWRLKPPRVMVVKGDSQITVTWKYPWLPKIQRRIYWSEKLVLVADTTGWLGRTTTRSWPV